MSAIVFGRQHSLNFSLRLVAVDEEPRGWQNQGWHAECECGFVGPTYRHPLDASMGIRHDHVPAILAVDR